MEYSITDTVTQETGMSVMDLAEYLLTYEVTEKYTIRPYMTHLKLHKLLFYIQGYHLLFSGKALFTEDFVAHRTGYIIPEVYEEYKKYGAYTVPFTKSIIREEGFLPGTLEVLQGVLIDMGRLDSKTMEELLHQGDLYWGKENGDPVTKQEILMEFKRNHELIE